jgi:hypothetical protein
MLKLFIFLKEKINITEASGGFAMLISQHPD